MSTFYSTYSQITDLALALVS